MWQRLWHRIASPVDPFLGALLALILSFTTIVMLSASPDRIQSQLINTLIGLAITWIVANIPPQKLQSFALPLYIVGVLLLIAVALFGDVSKGARRWLHVGVTRIQPSELMKIAMPLMLAWYFQQRESALKALDFLVALVLLLIPVGLIAKQPDLGTAILVLSAGLFVIFFAGLSWRLIVPVMLAAIVGIAAFIVLAAWGVIAQGKDFDMQAFGIGFGSLVGGLGVYLMGDKSKPKEHAPGGEAQ